MPDYQMTTYGTTAGRNLVYAATEMLEHVHTVSVLGQFGLQKAQPGNRTDTIVWRRLNTFNMKANGTPSIDPGGFRLQEGVNPPTYGHTYTDVSSTLKQYGYVEKFSDKAAQLYEDDIPGDARTMTADVLAEIREMVIYGQLKAGTQVEYSNGTTRAGINTSLSLNSVRRAVRSLQAARANMITSKLSPGLAFASTPVKPSFLGFVHTDMIPNVRDLPHFKSVEEYASGRAVHESEIGNVENVRFLASPLFEPYLAAGAAVGTTGMKSENATNIDVYPVIITAANAWGQVALKGMSSMTPVLIPAVPSAATPLGMFGFVGAKMWMDAVRLNENFMVRIETAVTNLAG